MSREEIAALMNIYLFRISYNCKDSLSAIMTKCDFLYSEENGSIYYLRAKEEHWQLRN
ncbi:Uncharacterized protein dnm_070210 [Desulfonema magnum]|uniref:Uncharacterized protein n=1 Tax=Desulfonema magnum TaxID=45655 RepID=A0A975GRI3_9BACT|nr:Uncharacterized protein dnm_070210 [Desulfonema magnum]